MKICETPLSGVLVAPLIEILDERGKIQRFYRQYLSWDDGANLDFPNIQEVYFTQVNPNYVKGWHGYKTKNMLYACIYGNVELALFDNREESPTAGRLCTVYLGQDKYSMVYIPAGVMNAFKGISIYPSIVAVCTDEVFDEQTTVRWGLDAIDYDWGRAQNV